MNEANEEVATKFMRTFDERQATLWGLTVIAIDKRIEEAIGLPTVGEHYQNAHDARSTRA